MTHRRDVAVAELFGLADTFPRPGWVVLDALRDHRFTGEIVADAHPEVRLFCDRGHVYLAERATDPSIGSRLVDAGVLTAAELERGSVHIGSVEHLGRLFERVPSLDRHQVIVAAELMTDECVGWLAAQTVHGARSTPYRHHESGVHQWMRSPGWVDLRPGDPLPAPPAGEDPVEVDPPTEPAHDDPFEDVIEWNEPSWCDATDFEPAAERGGSDDRGDTEQFRVDTASEGDWVDRLETDGLPTPGSEFFGSGVRLPRLPIETIDRFELIWPSGEIDEEFGVLDQVTDDEHDRFGTTARLAARPRTSEPSPPSPGVDPVAPPAGSDDAVESRSMSSADDAAADDQVVLAVRRAVASIEVGSLAARQRLVDATGTTARGVNPPVQVDPGDDIGTADIGTDDTGAGDAPVDPSPWDGVLAPGRVAVRSGRTDWSRRTVARSVFDEPVSVPDDPEPAAPDPSDDDLRTRRAGALRRLITTLRR